jgi:hypothetical protein
MAVSSTSKKVWCPENLFEEEHRKIIHSSDECFIGYLSQAKDCPGDQCSNPISAVSLKYTPA